MCLRQARHHTSSPIISAAISAIRGSKAAPKAWGPRSGPRSIWREAGGWTLTAAYAREHGENASSNQLNSTFLREALGAIADNPATAYSAPRDGYFNPFADGSNSSPAALAFIGSGWARGVGETTVSSINALADGSLFTLPAGDAKLAAGLAFRRETFERQDTSFTSGVAPSVGVPVAFDRDVASAFAEVRIPLFSAENRRAGFERLELSIAGRFEKYSDAGQTTSPKVGVLWQPYSELVLRANYGESFRAPALRELKRDGGPEPDVPPARIAAGACRNPLWRQSRP